MQISADVTFIRKRIDKFDGRTSRYRGRGKIVIDDVYITVEGRRVHTPVMRAALGMIFFLLSIYLVNMLAHKVLHIQFYEEIIPIKAGVYTLLLILSLYLVEYVALARENFSIKFESVRKFAYFPQGRFAAVSINDLPRCSPVMFRCENMKEVIRALRKKIPEKEFVPVKEL
jgi:hypothetical protein